MIEEFKDIPNYEGIYQVSNFGNIKSLKYNKHKILNPSLDSFGYLYVGLSKDNIRKKIKIHQLVASAFLNHTICGMKLVVNHINFIKHDNRLENLEIVTQRENGNKKHLKSSSKYTGVTFDKSRNKWQSRIVIDGKTKHLGRFTKEIDASKAYENKLKEIKNG